MPTRPRSASLGPHAGIRQSACRWCFVHTTLQVLARAAAGLGLAGIDLVDPADFPVLRKHNLLCTLTPSHDLARGLCHPAHQQTALEQIRLAIDATAAAGFPNVVCFSGDRPRGLSVERATLNAVRALRKIIGFAERRRVTLCLELLNSKRDHPGYFCDHTAIAAGIIARLGSDRLKILYDIYHMQIMEGDVISTIQKHAPIIAHYHTAGVPGRHEIDQQQELNYPAIFRAIQATGFRGFIAHEFLPTQNPLHALKQAVNTTNSALSSPLSRYPGRGPG
jgi:hydroxypyruvate isomerase